MRKVARGVVAAGVGAKAPNGYIDAQTLLA